MLAFKALEKQDAADYDRLKGIILDRYEITLEFYRQ